MKALPIGITRHIIAPPDYPFRPLLAAWLEELERYCEWWNWEDVPWIHGERAAVGMLSTATTRIGAVNISEYKATKKSLDETSLCNGLCDLSISLFLSAQRYDLDCEAKEFDIDLSKPDAFARFANELSKTKKCAGRITHKSRKLALLFARIGISLPADQNRASELLAKLVADLGEHSAEWHADACAVFSTTHNRWRYAPGTALFVKDLS